MQWAAVTTLVAETRVPPQNWFCEASVICMTYGYVAAVVVVPPTMGWGAAIADGGGDQRGRRGGSGGDQDGGGLLGAGEPEHGFSSCGDCRWGDARVYVGGSCTGRWCCSVCPASGTPTR